MKEEHKVNIVAMLGEDKANIVFKQIEESAKQKVLHEEREKAELARMTNSMIDKGYLLDGAYYNGHRFRGPHVAMWDAERSVFLSFRFKHGHFDIETVPYFGDVANTNQDGFIPFDKIEKRKV